MHSDASTSADISAAASKGHSPLRDMARLGFKSIALLTAVLTTVAGVALSIPDGSSYALASVTKHQRLTDYDTRKIVLVGGSNLAFGIDSTVIQSATGCPVVNMGMNGYLGVRFMLEEIKTDIKPSDLVVIVFEWDNFYKSIDGTSRDLLAIVKVNPVAIRYLSYRQRLGVIATIPLVAHEKVKRVTRESLLLRESNMNGSSLETDNPAEQLIERVETFSGFTAEGDLISHLGVNWPYKREDGIIPKGAPIEPLMIPLMRDFTVEMAKRDVAVMVSYTPTISTFFDRYQNELSDAHTIISATPPLIAPSPPSAYVYGEQYFFDTVYHLNAEGRQLRTQKLIDDLKLQFKERVQCKATATAASGD